MRFDIALAIQHRRLIEIFYPPGVRTIEPHALGYSRAGDLLLRAYQRDGASASGEPDQWKLFRLDRIRHLEVRDETFVGVRPDYNPDDSHMRGGIIARL